MMEMVDMAEVATRVEDFLAPTIGRIVHLRSLGNDDQALVGIVTFVHSPKLINVAMFDKNGRHEARTSIQHSSATDAPGALVWDWPQRV